MSKTARKKLRFPNVYVLLTLLALFAAALSWIVPAGVFDRTTVDGITEVVPGSYHSVPAVHLTPWDVCLAIVQGFNNQSRLIFMIFFVGAAIRMLDDSKAISVAFT